jgi:predicted nucleic acid-binding protein
MLLDSNIIIYAARPEHEGLRRLIREHTPAVSAVSYVEVLGYHQLNEQEARYFEEFFAASEVLGIDTPVLEGAVRLRKARRMTLGDALVAATALAHGLTLVTRNTKDFDWIADLPLFDPFEEAPGETSSEAEESMKN